MYSKFKVWDKQNEVMLEGNDVAMTANGLNLFVLNKETGLYEATWHNDYEMLWYTGRDDVNKQPIYSDYIMQSSTGTWLVSFEPESAAFTLVDYYFNSIGADTDLKVLGNIYENPELLKEGARREQ